MKQVQQPDYFVDQYGNRMPEGPARTGDSLDVGFGGPIGNLMEKLAYAKQVMEITDEMYPYEKTGVKRSGKLTSAKEELSKVNTKTPLKSLREEIQDDDYEPEVPSMRQLPRSQQKQTQAPVKQQNKKPLYEDDNYIYYAKDGVDDEEDERYDVRRAPSLTSELAKAAKGGQQQQSGMPDLSMSLDEQMIRNSGLPDYIKQSFLKNPLTPPKLSSALGNGHLDAITKEFRKQKLLKNKQEVQAVPRNVHAVPKNKLVEQKVEPIVGSKREKIKAQLKPIVEELIREILLTRL